MQKVFEEVIPYRLESYNKFSMSHWRVKQRENNTQKNWASWLFRDKPNINLPCKIVFTRISPRFLDYDNLVISLKTFRDAVANYLNPGFAWGQADSDNRMKFEYNQKKGLPKEYALLVEIYK